MNLALLVLGIVFFFLGYQLLGLLLLVLAVVFTVAPRL